MRLRRRGTRSAVKGQLTVIAMTIMAVVFLILAAVTQTISTASQQDQQTILASSGENLAQSAAAWLTNHLNSDPNYIADGLGPFNIDGTYTPPIGGSSVTHGFVSQWFQFDQSGHYQGCNTNLVQPCVRFDPATARFSTAYNPASTAIPTSLKEQNVVATIEVEQGCNGVASGCKDSYYSTTIARRGYYNYLAFTNYATLDPAQYSPLGLVNPGSVCQTNNAASGCVPVSYQSNGTASPNGIFGGGAQTAPVFSGTPGSGLYEAKIDANHNLVPDSTLAFALSPLNPTWRPNGPGFGSSANQWLVRNAGTPKSELVYAGDGQSSGYNSVFTPTVTLTAGSAYTISADINASEVTSGDNCAFQIIQENGPLEAQAQQSTSGNGVVSATWTPTTTGSYYFNAICYQVVVPTGSYVYFSNLQVTQSTSIQSGGSGPLYTSSSNVTLEGWADVPSTGGQGMVAFSGNTGTGFGMAIANGPCLSSCSPGFEVVVLYQMVRWIPTGVNVTPGWHQFTLVVNASGQPSVYVDGKLVYSDTGSPPNTPTAPVQIGTDGSPGRYYAGAIADVSVYNKALSASQILDQYNAGASGSYDAVVALDNPVGFWEMSDPPGSSQMPDVSGNDNIGAYLGNVAVVQPGPFAGNGSQAVTAASTTNNGDSLYGALRTNSPTIFVCDGNSSAFDVPLVQATSARVMTATQPGCGLPSSATTVAQQVSPMAMPTNVSALAQAAFPYIFPDGTSFDFTPNGIDISFTGSSSYLTNNWPALDSALTAANTVVLMSGSLVSIQNMAIPSNGVLYVNGNVSNVVGVVNGQVTIAAEGNIDVNAQPDATVGENLYYYCNGQSAVNPQVIPSGCTDLLGLDAQGSIAIGPQSYQQTGWAYYGTGSAAGWTWAYSPNITVTPGETYTVSAAIDASAASPSGYPPYIGVLNDALTTGYAVAYQTPGANGMLSATFTDPAGVTQVRVLADTNNVTVDNGKAVVWSNATVTQQGSTTNLVQPMSSWALAGTFGTSPGDWNLVPSELPPMVVDAAMTALGNSPGVVNSNGSVYATQWQTPNPNKQNPSCLIDAPSLTINGAMISQYQGTFGQYLGLYPSSNPCLVSGYHKHFFWDGRLAYEQPPFALSPGSGNFVEMGLTEVSRP